MEKIKRTSLFLVPFMFCMMGISAFIFGGCEKVPAKPEPPRNSPESYMKDPVFRQALEEQRQVRNDLARSRNIVVDKMIAMIEAKKKELKTEDLEKVRVELEKDPEWKSLYQRCLDANQAIKDNRKKTLGIVRERIAPEKKTKDGQISK